MTTVMTPAPATVRYAVSCRWCGTTFAEFTCSLPVESLVFAPQYCGSRKCGRAMRVAAVPKVRAVS